MSEVNYLKEWWEKKRAEMEEEYVPHYPTGLHYELKIDSLYIQPSIERCVVCILKLVDSKVCVYNNVDEEQIFNSS